MKTLEETTATMHNLEKIIQHFNRKYNFDIDKAPAIEQQAYSNLLGRWDSMKRKRDILKSQSIKK